MQEAASFALAPRLGGVLAVPLAERLAGCWLLVVLLLAP